MWELRDLRIFLQDLEQTPSRVIHGDIRFVREGLDLLGRNRISWSFNSLTSAASGVGDSSFPLTCVASV